MWLELKRVVFFEYGLIVVRMEVLMYVNSVENLLWLMELLFVYCIIFVGFDVIKGVLVVR